jgi:hypothetical protein
VAMNVRFETTPQEIAVESIEMREFFLHVIIAVSSQKRTWVVDL